MNEQKTNNKRSWVLVATWFGSIALVGLLKRLLDKQQQSS